MKIVIVNGSPSKEKVSIVQSITGAFAAGAEAAGAVVETFNLKSSEIKPCIGCLHCWSPHSGSCIIADRMSRELFPRFREADLAVMATPIYHHTMSGLLKNFIDRTTPLSTPIRDDADVDDSIVWHPDHPRIVTIAAGSNERNSKEYRLLSELFQEIYKEKLSGEIYFDHSTLVGHHVGYRSFFKSFLTAVNMAGKDMVRKGRFSPVTTKLLTTPLKTRDSLLIRKQLVWHAIYDQQLSLEKFLEGDRRLYPLNLDWFIKLMELAFNPRVEVKALKIQFSFSDLNQSCYFEVEGDSLSSGTGECKAPDLSIECPYRIWLEVLNQKTGINEAVQSGGLKIEGNKNLMPQMSALFSDVAMDKQLY